MNLAGLQSKINELYGYTPSEADLLADPNLIDISIEAMRANVANLSDVAEALNTCFGSSDTAQSLIARPDRIKLGMAILAADNSPAPSGAGKLLDFQYNRLITKASQSVPANAQTAINGLNIDFTPVSASSKLLISVEFNGACPLYNGESASGNIGFGLFKNGSALGNPVSNYFSYMNESMLDLGGNRALKTLYSFVDDAVNTSLRNYSATIFMEYDSNTLLFINRNGINNNSLASLITIQEIAP